jgi:hypothetical protein
MKINDKDLINQYKAFIKSKSLHSRKQCPSRENLAKAFDTTTSEKQKTKIINHLSECHHCAEEFEILRQIFKSSREMNKELRRIFATDQRAKTKQTKSATPFLRFSPKYLSWAAALVVLFIGTILIVKWPGFLSEKHEERGPDKIKIELVEPIDGKSIAKPVAGDTEKTLIFKWGKFPEAEYYKLKLYNEALILLYESEKIQKNSLGIPPEIVEGLPVNQTYFWMVSAYIGIEQIAESDLKHFKLVIQ